MKKLGLLLLIVFLGTTISMAQNRGGQSQGNFDPVESSKKQTAELKEELDLNKDQEKKVYDIVLKGSNKMAEMRKDMQSGGDRTAMREKFGELRKEQNTEMKKVLTDDQYKKYEKYLENRRSSRGSQGSGGNR
ncbi:MAG: hypothetical protein KAH68_05695 [Draconibacterium sp.]|nr:hypothetical protein [Draconibacterium sp.]